MSSTVTLGHRVAAPLVVQLGLEAGAWTTPVTVRDSGWPLSRAPAVPGHCPGNKHICFNKHVFLHIAMAKSLACPNSGLRGFPLISAQDKTNLSLRINVL